jgi:hypothetical protein
MELLATKEYKAHKCQCSYNFNVLSTNIEEVSIINFVQKKYFENT